MDAPLDRVMPEVLQNITARQTPIALVEPADNIGGGAPGDGATILRALLDHQIERAAVVINDPTRSLS